MLPMVRLLRGNRRGVDFAQPIRMTEAQRSRFLNFLRDMFAVVEEEEVTEFRSERLGEKSFPRRWTSRELALLVEVKDVAQVAELLGRTWISVTIKRGGHVAEFLQWVKAQGHNLATEDIRELIDEFLEERRRMQMERRRAQAEGKKKLRRLERELDRLRRLRKMHELAVQAGQAAPEIVEETERDIRDAERKLTDFEARKGVE